MLWCALQHRISVKLGWSIHKGHLVALSEVEITYNDNK